MKGNGQSIWSKMDREQSNVTHDSSTLAVRFFTYAANRVDNVVLSLGYISQTHVMNTHNTLSTYLLCHARNVSDYKSRLVMVEWCTRCDAIKTNLIRLRTV